MNQANAGRNFYSYIQIRRVNTFLANIDQASFTNEAVRKDMIAQVRFIRAYQYFKMNWWYGGVPIITDLSTSADDAQRTRNTEEEVKKFVFDEIDLALLDINDIPKARGYAAKGAVLMLKMRSALYYDEYQRALDAARAIVALNQYELHHNFSHLFSYAGKDSEEIILSVQKLRPTVNEWFITIPNNLDGGWSSMVPTQNLINMYEMANGLTIDDPASGYNPVYPFYGRDPRMAMTVLVPGINWTSSYNGILNTLDNDLPNGNRNQNHPTAANNASKTGLTWAKYLLPIEQYYNADGRPVWDPTETQYIVYRYAEVLLTLAEVSNELNGPSSEVYDALDAIRNRAGMPNVDRTRYSTKETLQELIRRERTIELAGEGHRRADILRWRDSSGKMLAETVLNAPLNRVTGTINYSETEPFKRAVIGGIEAIEVRRFETFNRYLPFRQDNLDRNPRLVQNSGY
jgi:hypothetical protein